MPVGRSLKSAHFTVNSLYLHIFNGCTEGHASSKGDEDGETKVPCFKSKMDLRVQAPRRSYAQGVQCFRRSGAAPFLPRFTLIGSQDLVGKSTSPVSCTEYNTNLLRDLLWMVTLVVGLLSLPSLGFRALGTSMESLPYQKQLGKIKFGFKNNPRQAREGKQSAICLERLREIMETRDQDGRTRIRTQALPNARPKFNCSVRRTHHRSIGPYLSGHYPVLYDCIFRVHYWPVINQWGVDLTLTQSNILHRTKGFKINHVSLSAIKNEILLFAISLLLRCRGLCKVVLNTIRAENAHQCEFCAEQQRTFQINFARSTLEHSLQSVKIRHQVKITVLSVLKPSSFLHWLLHRREATPFLAEIHGVSDKSRSNDKRSLVIALGSNDVRTTLRLLRPRHTLTQFACEMFGDCSKWSGGYGTRESTWARTRRDLHWLWRHFRHKDLRGADAAQRGHDQATAGRRIEGQPVVQQLNTLRSAHIYWQLRQIITLVDVDAMSSGVVLRCDVIGKLKEEGRMHSEWKETVISDKVTFWTMELRPIAHTSKGLNLRTFAPVVILSCASEIRNSGILLHAIFERLLTTGSYEPMRVKRGEGGAAPECKGGGEKTGNPRENPPTSGVVRHDFLLRKSGVARPEYNRVRFGADSRLQYRMYISAVVIPPLAAGVVSTYDRATQDSRKIALRGPDSYQRNTIKKARVAGKEYIDTLTMEEKSTNSSYSRTMQKTGYSVEKQKTFKYHVLLEDKKIEVCRDAFFRLYDVTDKRIHQHITSFPVKEAHYTSRSYKYLSAELSVAKMYSMFKNKFPKTTVKYSFYLKYFNENFSLRFGRPQYSSEKKDVVKASEFLGGLVSHTFVLGKIPYVSLSPTPAYPARRVLTKKPKVKDLKKACCYIPEIRNPVGMPRSLFGVESQQATQTSRKVESTTDEARSKNADQSIPTPTRTGGRHASTAPCAGSLQRLVAFRSLGTARDLSTSESEVHLRVRWDHGSLGAATIRDSSLTQVVDRRSPGSGRRLSGRLGTWAAQYEMVKRICWWWPNDQGGEGHLQMLKNAKCSDPHCWILLDADCGCGRGWLPERTLPTFTHGLEILVSARKGEDGVGVMWLSCLVFRRTRRGAKGGGGSVSSDAVSTIAYTAVLTVAQFQGQLRSHDD
ncbi:hypothetical protein PR048_003704 [Dryococelus australis]|uniref:Uncharacterized protein n=1 Tax=Dryococelus australis TaxID=614101 RepID=A0ABQ9IQ00_9NEOP|nr:hypothetical protein PR048_003704 [Dryococelus australis]